MSAEDSRQRYVDAVEAIVHTLLNGVLARPPSTRHQYQDVLNDNLENIKETDEVWEDTLFPKERVASAPARLPSSQVEQC